MLFENIKPFVRYARLLDTDIKIYHSSLIAYDSRLYYCTGGSGRIFVGEKTFAVKKGTLILWRAGMPYKYEPFGEDSMQFIALNFDFTYKHADQSIPIPPDNSDAFNPSYITDDASLSDVPAMNSTILLEGVPQLSEKFTAIQNEYSMRKNYYALRCSGILTDLLAVVANYTDADDKKGFYNTTVNRIIAYLHEHYKEQLTNQSIGAQFGYHPNYINQLFVRSTGRSLHKYLQDMRIHKAIQLLQDTEQTVAEISVLTGFNDFAHFSKYFKQITGVSPSYFKR